MADKIDKEIVGYVCATVLGVALLLTDGDMAIAYALGVGGAMVGVQVGKSVNKK